MSYHLEPGEYFDAVDLGLDSLGPYVTVNISDTVERPGYRTAVVTVQEPLRFHHEYDRLNTEEPSRLFNVTDSGRIDLTDAAREAMERVIHSRYGGEDFAEDGDDDDAFITFDLVLEVADDTTPDALSEAIWERTKLVQFANEADPGTFGSEYLFGTILADTMKTQDN